MQIRLDGAKHLKREHYRSFIRAITAAIMMRVTGFNQWNPKPKGFQFWDLRPFTRIVSSFKYIMNLRDYIQINKLEGFGVDRLKAYFLVKSKMVKSGKLFDSINERTKQSTVSQLRLC
jgi:hypothetical protein